MQYTTLGVVIAVVVLTAGCSGLGITDSGAAVGDAETSDGGTETADDPQNESEDGNATATAGEESDGIDGESTESAESSDSDDTIESGPDDFELTEEKRAQLEGNTLYAEEAGENFEQFNLDVAATDAHFERQRRDGYDERWTYAEIEVKVGLNADFSRLLARSLLGVANTSSNVGVTEDDVDAISEHPVEPDLINVEFVTSSGQLIGEYRMPPDVARGYYNGTASQGVIAQNVIRNFEVPESPPRTVSVSELEPRDIVYGPYNKVEYWYNKSTPDTMSYDGLTYRVWRNDYDGADDDEWGMKVIAQMNESQEPSEALGDVALATARTFGQGGVPRRTSDIINGTAPTERTGDDRFTFQHLDRRNGEPDFVNVTIVDPDGEPLMSTRIDTDNAADYWYGQHPRDEYREETIENHQRHQEFFMDMTKTDEYLRGGELRGFMTEYEFWHFEHPYGERGSPPRLQGVYTDAENGWVMVHGAEGGDNRDGVASTAGVWQHYTVHYPDHLLPERMYIYVDRPWENRNDALGYIPLEEARQKAELDTAGIIQYNLDVEVEYFRELDDDEEEEEPFTENSSYPSEYQIP